MQQKTNRTRTGKKDKKFWTTFTYHSPKIRKITNLFKNTNTGIASRTTSIHQLTKPIIEQTIDNEKSGVYQLTCNTCQRSYIGQTKRNFKSRFQKHARYIKNNDPQSAYALHILNCRHEYGNINDTMTLLKHINSPSLLLPYEQMYIQLFHYNN
jgi:phosphoribulokinase